MSKRVLPRDYSAEQMDRGEGMMFHPCRDGFGVVGPVRLSSLEYDEKQGQYFREVLVGWGSCDVSFLRISDGKDWKCGDPYPDHWALDPWTGEHLAW